MKGSIPIIVLAALSVTVAASVGRSSPPDPANSEVDPCLVVCPAGDFAFRVLVRDFNNVPEEGSAVVIDFCGCSNVTLCPQSMSDPYQHPGPCQILKVADSQGRVEFATRAGGVCGNSGARVYADGVLPALRNVASPDQDGNLNVEPVDLAIVNGKVGSSDPTADFDCDGSVTNADAQLVFQHAQHHCPPPDPTPAIQRSWGQLKTIYR